MKRFVQHMLVVMAVVVGSMMGHTVSAEVVTQKQARRIAQAFFDHAHGIKTAAVDYVYNGKALTTNRLMTPFYLFNHPKGGYVIVSAENKCFPILGYNLDARFDKGNIDESLFKLLSLYAKHVEQIRYDSRLPEDAIAAWQDLPTYIDNLLKAQPSVFGRAFDDADALMRLESVLSEDDSTVASQLSSTYTPEQWNTLISDQLTADKSVAIGLIDDNRIVPMVVNGQKADMYLVSIDGKELGWYRLLASEVMSHGQIASTSAAPIEEVAEPEEEPFAYYHSYYRQMQQEREQAQTAIEQVGIVTSPIVGRLGGGHYSIKMPKPIEMVCVYTLDGTMTMQLSYGGVEQVLLNLSALNTGFYFAMLKDVDGGVYGIKLIR